MSIEEKIHHRFIQNNWSLALAESCTGGGLAARLVALADCSLYFQGGVVAYSNKAKVKNLGVRPSTLENFGAVSEQTAREMAAGALDRFETDFALATTGIAGPTGGTPQKPVGMVCFALASKEGEPLSWTSHFAGGRGEVIEQAIADALGHLSEYSV